jgi:hypothetical protein
MRPLPGKFERLTLQLYGAKIFGFRETSHPPIREPCSTRGCLRPATQITPESLHALPPEENARR